MMMMFTRLLMLRAMLKHLELRRLQRAAIPREVEVEDAGAGAVVDPSAAIARSGA